MIAVFFFIPLILQAAILPACAVSNQKGANLCNLCDIIQTGVNIFRWILGIFGGAALLLFIWHSFSFLSSGGKTEKIETAKKGLVHTIIGLVIVLGSWTIVNMVIALLTTPEGSLPPQFATIFSGQSWNKYCAGVNVVKESAEEAAELANHPSLAGYTFQAGIYRQLGEASSELLRLLGCLRPKLAAGVGVISSITDSNFIGRLKICEAVSCPHSDNGADCDEVTCCVHKCNSCHYGGGQGNGSHAVDFADTENFDEINSAVRSADCSVYAGYIASEGDHIHISTRACLADGDNIPAPD